MRVVKRALIGIGIVVGLMVAGVGGILLLLPFFDDNNRIDDSGGHGTQTAGTLVGDGACSGTITGQAPEALAVGYLRNQRLVGSPQQILSVQVDWETAACAITTTGFDIDRFRVAELLGVSARDRIRLRKLVEQRQLKTAWDDS